MGAVFHVVQRLDDEGPIAFLLAPDENNIDITMSVAFYTNGRTKYSVMAYDNDKNSIAKNESTLYEQAMNACNDGFGDFSQSKNDE